MTKSNYVSGDKMRDFIEFEDYSRLMIPVRCGPTRPGIVKNFMHNSRTANELESYVAGLTNLIEIQKNEYSQRGNFDVGPAIAMATIVNDNLHRGVILPGKEPLTPLEQIFEVEEGNDIFHIIPKRSLLSYKMGEERGLIMFSIYESLKENADRSLESQRWAEKHCNAFRDIFDKSEDTDFMKMLNESLAVRIYGNNRRYDNCHIFRNLSKNLVEKLRINEEKMERIDAPSVFRAYQNAYSSLALA